jgi:hypothetical protein
MKMARYFPMALYFNDDPETWELTILYGDRALRLVIEIFSILERNRNEWKLVDRWQNVLGRKLRMSPAKCCAIVGWMLAKHWLIVDQPLDNSCPDILRASKYWKYHKRRAAVSLPPNLTYKMTSHQNEKVILAGVASWSQKPQKTKNFPPDNGIGRDKIFSENNALSEMIKKLSHAKKM